MATATSLLKQPENQSCFSLSGCALRGRVHKLSSTDSLLLFIYTITPLLGPKGAFANLMCCAYRFCLSKEYQNVYISSFPLPGPRKQNSKFRWAFLWKIDTTSRRTAIEVLQHNITKAKGSPLRKPVGGFPWSRLLAGVHNIRKSWFPHFQRLSTLSPSSSFQNVVLTETWEEPERTALLKILLLPTNVGGALRWPGFTTQTFAVTRLWALFGVLL